MKVLEMILLTIDALRQTHFEKKKTKEIILQRISLIWLL